PPLPLWERGPGGEGKRSPPSPPAPLPQREEGGKSEVEPPLDRARRLADAGRLDDALAEAAPARPAADAVSLPRGVHPAPRRAAAAAAAALRKALYLDPAHREALTHAMLLASGQGDTGRAAALRERLARTGGEP